MSQQKMTMVTIRLEQRTVKALKLLAEERGMGYQTYLRMIAMIHVAQKEAEAKKSLDETEQS